MEETRARCNIIHDTIVSPLINAPPKEYKILTTALVNGLYYVHPLLDSDVLPYYIYMIIEGCNEEEAQKKGLEPLPLYKATKLKHLIFHLGAFRHSIVRYFFNYIFSFSLWIYFNSPIFVSKLWSHIILRHLITNFK